MKKATVLAATISVALALSSKPAFSADKPVKLLGIMVLSGVVGAVPETGWGLLDGCDWINENGGINGKKFECILEDGRYDVPLSESIYNRYLSEPKDELFFVSGYQTGVLKALAEKNNKEAKLVWIDGSMATEISTRTLRRTIRSISLQARITQTKSDLRSSLSKKRSTKIAHRPRSLFSISMPRPAETPSRECEPMLRSTE